MALVYFLYSDEQIAEKNLILGTIGKKFLPGNVVVGGKKKKFTQIYHTNKLPRYSDVTIVAKGEKGSFVYNDVSVISKEGQ